MESATERVIYTINKYLSDSGETEFTAKEAMYDGGNSDTVAKILKEMIVGNQIKVVRLIPKRGTAIRVFTVIKLPAKVRQTKAVMKDSYNIDGWRRYFPEFFFAPNIDGNLRIINGMKELK